MPYLNDLLVVAGLLSILYASIMILVPPRFGDFLYGVSTKLTLKNETVWASGQRLFAFSFIGIGIILVVLGALKIDEVQALPKALFVIALWTIAKYSVHKILLNKYPKG